MEFDSFREKASLLILPIETRFMIYDLIVNPTGSLTIFSQYELAKSVDKETIHLLHVNRLVRAEIHEYFYKNQIFEFRSFPAMEKFLDKIGTYYASIIKNVVIGSWLAQRAAFAENIAPLVKKLTGIDRLTIQAPAHGFVTDWSDQAEMGEKAIAVRNASERLGAGKLHLGWVDFQGQGLMQFVAPNIPQPSTDDPLFQKLVLDMFMHRSYPWQKLDFVHFVEVRDLDCLPESSGTQTSQRDISADDFLGEDRFVLMDDDEGIFGSYEDDEDVLTDEDDPAL